MSGIDAAAGGVLSVNNSSSRKNATNIFIPENNDNMMIIQYGDIKNTGSCYN